MPELIKQAASLTVLKVRLSNTLPPQNTSVETAQPTEGVSQVMRVVCELEFTGTAEERGLVLPAGQADAAEELQSSIPQQPLVRDPSSGVARLIAQWCFSPEEIQLPIDYVQLTRGRPALTGEVVVNLAKAAVSRVANEFTVDAFERVVTCNNWLPSGTRTLPGPMLRELSLLLGTLLHKKDSLWIEFCEPAGYLPMLPWEKMLRPATKMPILRLSPHPREALSAKIDLSVVTCVTAPTKAFVPMPNQLATLVHAIHKSLPGNSQVHIFADDLCFPACSQAVIKEKYGKTRSIYLHEMSTTERHALAGSPRPWTDWILKSLGDGGADIVHCIATSTLSPDQPRLVVARDVMSPAHRKKAASDRGARRDIRYITGLDHAEFVRSLGAWAAVFSGPVRRAEAIETRLGLRLFAHQFATLRPGISVYHNFTADPRCESLSETYNFLTGDFSVPASTSTSVAVYCHPARATPFAVQAAQQPSPLVREYSRLEEAVKHAIDLPGPLPAWVATAQRLAEETISNIEMNDEPNLNSARSRGIASALKFIERAVTEQIKNIPTSTNT